MYASIRRYKVSSAEELTRQVNAGFLPIISQAPGFISYYGIDSGGGVWTSVSIFESQDAAEESNRMAADWVKRNAATMISGAPDITTGEVVVSKTAARGTAQTA